MRALASEQPRAHCRLSGERSPGRGHGRACAGKAERLEKEPGSGPGAAHRARSPPRVGSS